MKYNKGDFYIMVNKKALSGKSMAIRSVFMALCSFANDDGICYPSLETLAKEAGTTKRTVIRTLKEIEELGLVQKSNRYNGVIQSSNLYQIMLVDMYFQDIPVYQTATPPSDIVSPPSDIKDTGGSDTRAPLTTSNINYTKLTTSKATALRSPFRSGMENAGNKITEVSIEHKNAIKILSAFQDINPSIKTMFGNKTQLKACKFLIDEYGLQATISVIQEVLPKTNVRPRYEFPHISTPDQLMKNWVKVKDGIQTKHEEKLTAKNKYPTI